MRIASPLWSLSLLLLVFFAGVTARAADAPVPLTAFFGNPGVSGAKLSPDGKRLAMLVSNESGHDQLGVIDLADNSIKVVGTFRDADVGYFEWVNNGRLVYDSRDKTTAPGKERYAPGLYAVNADGSVRRQLVDTFDPWVKDATVLEREKMPWNTYLLRQPGAQDSDWVYVMTVNFSRDEGIDEVGLVRLNTLNGANETVKAPRWTRE
jgi:hypothetical protein